MAGAKGVGEADGKRIVINLFQPNLGESELKAVREVFESGWLGRGSCTAEFERLFADALEVKPECVHSTASCSDIIFGAFDLFNLGRGSEVIVPSVSFIAVGSAVQKSGAELVLCDVNPHSLNTCAEMIEASITKKTRAVFLTHYGGVPCDMDPIVDLCASRNIMLIEDTACAPFAKYKGRAAGTFGQLGMWSLDAMKLITTGDGGMAHIPDFELMERFKRLTYLGVPSTSRSGLDRSNTAEAMWWAVDISEYGRRSILNNIAGAIGISQIKTVGEKISRRQKIVDQYNKLLCEFPQLTLPPNTPEYINSCPYFYWIQLNNRDNLANHLKESGVYTTFRYWPLHNVRLFGLESRFDLSGSDYARDHTLNLPLHESLTERDVEYIVDKIRDFFERSGV